MKQQPVPPSPAVDLLTAVSRGSEDAAAIAMAPQVSVVVPQLVTHLDGVADAVATWRRS
jgi:hypothetical protein